MNRVLIAEDEKMIRKGLKVLVERSGVPVSEILEARNGVEALEILKSTEVDLLITDVRMPNMDGMELVQAVKKLPQSPKVLVVSGYDDFNYAVTMLRGGAHDYLLKPVQRDDFYKALAKIQTLLEQDQFCEEKREEQRLMTLQYLMLNPRREEGEYQKLLTIAKAAFPNQPYRIRCVVPSEEMDGICIRGEGKLVYQVFFTNAQAPVALKEMVSGYSEPLTGLENLNKGYHQSLSAWKYSFFSGKTEEYDDVRPDGRCQVTAEQLLQQAGLSRDKEVLRLLSSAGKMVLQRLCAPDDVAQLCAEFMQSIGEAYPNQLEDDASLCRLASVWEFENWQQYLEAVADWLEPFCRRVEREFLDYENKNKIRQAVQYIQQNYHMPLNMAIVSNRVSMNYSLFSLLFKQYTGRNFVSYLQEIRIEEAQQLLKKTDWKVNEIGRKVGFSDEKHFLKVFKSCVGVSPSEWRKAQRQQNSKGSE